MKKLSLFAKKAIKLIERHQRRINKIRVDIDSYQVDIVIQLKIIGKIQTIRFTFHEKCDIDLSLTNLDNQILNKIENAC